MPELPEVEALRRKLSRALEGRTILEVRAEPGRRYQNLEEAVGGRIQGIDRRGKYLFFHLGARDLIVHLGLTGWLCLGREGDRPPHTRVEIVLDGPDRLYFEDTRRFGRIYVVPAGQLPASPTLERMGPEPLTPEFREDAFVRAVTGRAAPIKAQLMSQEVVAGLGNIYSDEALWRAGIHPARRDLTEAEARRLYSAIQEVIREALAQGGIEEGTFRMQVHRRAGEPCERCGTAIETRRIAGRTAYYCPRCQPERGS